jgi:predicted enzyme related to lactoylglutathione lyase
MDTTGHSNHRSEPGCTALDLVQTRIVARDVATLARFYAELVGTNVVVNDYYVEVPTRAQRVGLARARFSEWEEGTCGPPAAVGTGAVILDFAADDIDEEHERLDALGADWLMGPTLQPWGRRSMMLRDPEDHLINVFEKKEGES